MGVDLRLLIPIDRDGAREWTMAGASIEVGRDYDLYDSIRSLPSLPWAPCKLYAHGAQMSDGNDGYGEIDEDPYGDPIRWVAAAALADRMMCYDLKHGGIANPIAKAAMRFVEALPLGWPVVLYWH